MTGLVGIVFVCVCTRACVGVGTTSVRTDFGEHTYI
ncbi:hypothetical protein GLYMA_17G051150v4 [Glycine max]|nr:hypothetical protein GLYMA_17G051150v4 [Glycine max]KAH1116862.1 hypothetical protein GYH30_046305 [Glycine max]